MISIQDAVTLMLTGAGVMLTGIVSGCIVHMRWLDRRLYKPYPKKAIPPAVPKEKQ
jgi:hypothetical protein